MPTSPHPPRTLSVGAALRIYYFASFAAFGVYLPFLPAWLAEQGLHGLEMSAIVALRSGFGMISPIVFGLIADTFGLRGSLLRLACGVCALSFGVLALLAGAGVSLGFGLLFALLTLFSLCRTPMSTLADVTAMQAAGVDYGRVRLWGSFGFMVVALGAGSLLDAASVIELPLAMTVGLSIALITAFALPPSSGPPPRPAWADARRLLKTPPFRWLLLTVFLWQAGHASYDLGISLHLYDLGAAGSTVGAAWSIGVVAEIAVMAASSALLRRLGAANLLLLGVAGSAVRWWAISSTDSVAQLLWLQPLHGLSFGAVWVAALELVRRRAPAHIWASAQGLSSAAMATGATAGMLVWGPVYERAGGAALFGFAAIVATAASVMALLARHDRGAELAPSLQP